MEPACDIKEFRKDNNLTQQEMARFLGVCQRTVSRWERGVDRPGPDIYSRLRSFIDDKGADTWAMVYECIRSAAFPVAVVDGHGKVLVSSNGYVGANASSGPKMGCSDSRQERPVKTILVIDDDDAVLKATRAVLRRWQFLSAGAISGEMALQMVVDGTARPDAAIIDFLLPGQMDGVDTANALRRLLPDLPILLISGEATPDRMRKISESGLPLIPKPVDPDKIKMCLTSLVT